LVPGLCRELKEQLLKESEAAKTESAKQVIATAETQLLQSLDSLKIDGKSLSAPIRLQLRKKITEVLSGSIQSDSGGPRLHELSSTEANRLIGWLESGISDVAKVCSRHASRLEALHRNQVAVETQLSKIPPDEQIRPLLEDLKAKYQLLGVAQQELAAIKREEEDTRNRLAEAERRFQKTTDRLSHQAATESRLHTVPKIRAALEEFKSLLIVRKVRELESSVTTSFNVLCRKKDSMRRISIDPTSFAVTVIDRDGQPIPKAQLSAGEKQIYAISMLWALARTSRRPLPIIIDTPLARLDRDHRQLLAHNYFPHASHQVLMLSTDTEVDESYFESLAESISAAYLLEFSAEERCTTVKAGYFWRNKSEAYQVASH